MTEEPERDSALGDRSLGRTPGRHDCFRELWVSGMSRDMEIYRTRLDLHDQSIDELMAILNTDSENLDRAMEVITTTRKKVRRLYTCLALMVGVLVMMIGPDGMVDDALGDHLCEAFYYLKLKLVFGAYSPLL